MKAAHEKVLLGQDASFQCFENVATDFPFHWHYHPEFELTLIQNGRGKRYVGDSIEEYKAGELVLLGASLPHTWESDPVGHLDSQDRQSAVVVQFLPELFGDSEARLPECYPIRQFLARAGRGLQLDASERLRGQIRALPRMAGLPRLLSLFGILHTLAEEASSRPLASEGFAPQHQDADKQRFDQVHQYLQDRLQEPLRLEQVARDHHMSLSTFNRFIKRSTGKTLTVYLNHLRIGRACVLLIETEKSVTEIAFDAGYGNLSHFNRNFYRLRGMPPTEYRRFYRIKG